MAKCRLCNKESLLISSCLGVCADCIRNDFKKAFSFIQQAHTQARKAFNLPPEVPRESGGKSCGLCVNACEVGASEVGFCGLPINSRKEASVSWYYDPLPTNCVADWVCAGSVDFGYKNLAVFYNACSFNCLFCQNWHFREADLNKKVSALDLAKEVDEKTSCICYFGGDPTCQLAHSILASKIARDLNKDKPLRICWETNGSMAREYLKQILDISLESGGCIKFDIKSWSEELNIALCGVTNRQTLENFRFAASYFNRPRPAEKAKLVDKGSGKSNNHPILVASTLLVPGYVDIYEIKKISKFIADINPLIPYSLLAFHPQFLMADLPSASRSHAERAKETAKRCGLKNVKIGNIYLLNHTYNI